MANDNKALVVESSHVSAPALGRDEDGRMTRAEAEATGAWPADWRQQVTGGDAKALKTVERFADPSALWSAYRELREKFDGGGLVKVPGQGAAETERQALHKALGVPDSPEGYFDLIELPDGEVIGELDRPVAEDFARAVHGAGATPEVMSAAFAWYLRSQENQLAELDESDERDHMEGQQRIRAMWGPAETRMINAIGTLFAHVPGGTDTEGEGVFARLMSGRTGDGKLIGNDPEVLKFLGDLARLVHPHVTVTGAGEESAADLNGRIKEIEAMMRTSDPRYWKDESVQQEYRELIERRSALKRH